MHKAEASGAIIVCTVHCSIIMILGNCGEKKTKVRATILLTRSVTNQRIVRHASASRTAL